MPAIRPSKADVRFHRNGIAGPGFYVVRFRTRLPCEKERRTLNAIVFYDPDAREPSIPLESCPCAIIDPANPELRLSAEDWWRELCGLIDAQHVRDPMHAHERS